METQPLRTFLECKNLLQLSSDTKVGDWFLFENHRIIRVYGSMLDPFL